MTFNPFKLRQLLKEEQHKNELLINHNRKYREENDRLLLTNNELKRMLKQKDDRIIQLNATLGMIENIQNSKLPRAEKRKNKEKSKRFITHSLVKTRLLFWRKNGTCNKRTVNHSYRLQT